MFDGHYNIMTNDFERTTVFHFQGPTTATEANEKPTSNEGQRGPTATHDTPTH